MLVVNKLRKDIVIKYQHLTEFSFLKCSLYFASQPVPTFILILLQKLSYYYKTLSSICHTLKCNPGFI